MPKPTIQTQCMPAMEISLQGYSVSMANNTSVKQRTLVGISVVAADAIPAPKRFKSTTCIAIFYNQTNKQISQQCICIT